MENGRGVEEFESGEFVVLPITVYSFAVTGMSSLLVVVPNCSSFTPIWGKCASDTSRMAYGDDPDNDPRQRGRLVPRVRRRVGY
jgi:hypothetical protein